MAQYDISVQSKGGFPSAVAAKAHRQVVGKLAERMELAKSVASDCQEVDKAEVGNPGSELYRDLAAGQGHVIMLSQPEGGPLMSAELNYNPQDGNLRRLEVDMGDYKLTQQGSTFKLQEGEVTTYFRLDEKRGVITVQDPDSETPRIFGGVDPQLLCGNTLQLGQPILIF